MATTNARLTPRLTRRTFIQASTAAIIAPTNGCIDFADKPTAQAVPDTQMSVFIAGVTQPRSTV